MYLNKTRLDPSYLNDQAILLEYNTLKGVYQITDRLLAAKEDPVPATVKLVIDWSQISKYNHKTLTQSVTGNIPLFQINILFFHQWIWDTLTYRTQKCRDTPRGLSSRHKMTKTSTMASRCSLYTCHEPPKC